MRGREFLNTAQRLTSGTVEADFRSAISRSYYALFLECRDALLHWGFVFPARDSHREIQRRFSFPMNSDLNTIGAVLGYLVSRRNAADYEMTVPRHQQTNTSAADAVARAASAINLLDATGADSVRRAQAIADIRTACP